MWTGLYVTWHHNEHRAVSTDKQERFKFLSFCFKAKQSVHRNPTKGVLSVDPLGSILGLREEPGFRVVLDWLRASLNPQNRRTSLAFQSLTNMRCNWNVSVLFSRISMSRSYKLQWRANEKENTESPNTGWLQRIMILGTGDRGSQVFIFSNYFSVKYKNL